MLHLRFSAACGAALLLACALPAPASAQFVVAAGLRAGVAAPTRELSDYADPGASFGLDLSVARSGNTALTAAVDGYFLEGREGTGPATPDIRIARGGLGLTRLLVASEKVGLTTGIGIGVSRLATSSFAPAGGGAEAERRTLTTRFPSLKAGLAAVYLMSETTGIQLSGDFVRGFTDADRFEELRAVDPGLPPLAGPSVATLTLAFHFTI